MLMKIPRTVSQVSMMAVSGFALVVFLVSTRPSENNFRLSFIPLLLFWILLYASLGLLIRALFRHTRNSLSQMIRIAGASSIVLLIMFRALGQLSIIDVVVLLALVVLGSFYFSRTWRA